MWLTWIQIRKYTQHTSEDMCAWINNNVFDDKLSRTSVKSSRVESVLRSKTDLFKLFNRVTQSKHQSCIDGSRYRTVWCKRVYHNHAQHTYYCLLCRYVFPTCCMYHYACNTDKTFHFSLKISHYWWILSQQLPIYIELKTCLLHDKLCLYQRWQFVHIFCNHRYTNRHFIEHIYV